MGVVIDVTIKDTHTEHCCTRHGCKYGDDKVCTVTSGTAPQSYPCEQCGDEDMSTAYTLREILKDSRFSYAPDEEAFINRLIDDLTRPYPWMNLDELWRY